MLLVEDEAVTANLCELISRAQMRGRKGDARLRLEDFEGRSDGLIALCGGELARRARTERSRAAIARPPYKRDLRRAFLSRTPAASHSARDAAERAAGDARARMRLPYVATNAVVYAAKDDALVADVLACVRDGTTLAAARAANALRPNAEYHLKSPAAMRRLFARHPEGDRRTPRSPAAAVFGSNDWRGSFRSSPCAEEARPQRYLRELVYEGAAKRYPMPLETKVERQLEYELGLIAKMDLAGYFLIVWDIVREAARARGALPGTRIGGKLGGLLRARHNRGRSHRDESALRAIHVGGASRDSRYRHRLCPSRPRARHPIRLRALRASECGDGRRGDQLPNTFGDSRRR